LLRTISAELIGLHDEQQMTRHLTGVLFLANSVAWNSLPNDLRHPAVDDSERENVSLLRWIFYEALPRVLMSSTFSHLGLYILIYN